jgi:uncharacterized protein YutE (UPF0331/DUF86 family)
MRLPTRDDQQELFNFVVSLLNEATPRAMIIIGAARLEEETKDIVRIIAPGFDVERKSHSSRIELLLAIGHLTPKAANCLRNIAKIRNHFAHSSVVCGINDVAIQKVVTELFNILDELVNVSELTEGFFKNLLAKVPQSLAPHTWLDKDYRRYHLAISILHHHLRIVRCNLPDHAIPIEINQWSMASNVLHPEGVAIL